MAIGLVHQLVLFNTFLRYEHFARSAPAILDDSLSADSYLNVLYMPSTFPRSERSRQFLEAAKGSSMYNLIHEDGPRSNLDSVRYLECVNYLQEVSSYNCMITISTITSLLTSFSVFQIAFTGRKR